MNSANNNLEYVDFDDSADFGSSHSFASTEEHMEIDSDHQYEAEIETPMLDDSQVQDFATSVAPAEYAAGYTPTLPAPPASMQQHAADLFPASSPPSPPLEQNAAGQAAEDQVLPMCPTGPIYTDTTAMRPMVFLLRCDVDPESVEITLDFDPRFGHIYSETVQLQRVSPGLYQSANQSGPSRVFIKTQVAQLFDGRLLLKAQGNFKRCPSELKSITRRQCAVTVSARSNDCDDEILLQSYVVELYTKPNDEKPNDNKDLANKSQEQILLQGHDVQLLTKPSDTNNGARKQQIVNESQAHFQRCADALGTQLDAVFGHS